MTVHLRPPTFNDPLVGTALGATFDGGCTNQDREAGTNWANALVTGVLYLSYFRVPRAFTAANMAYYSSAAAAATPTLVKYGLFSVAANGDLTRIAVTASDTAIFAAAATRYSRALLASVALVPNTTYATGLLIVSGAATGTTVSPIASGTSAPFGQAPRMTAQISAQTDIQASYTAPATASALRPFAEITT